MIIFKYIRWRNFLSTGNQFTEINFCNSNTNLIVGNNGAGKSTLLDALCFCLFNKSYRKITKPQLVNSKNEKDCLVEIEFNSNGKEYLVRRGIKPNIFDIEINGKLLNRQSDDKENQKILEENILKVNFKSFTQIVILGSSSFVPFMQLTSANRREVIEDLLDIRIFSVMNNLVKENIRQKKDEIKELELKKQSIADKVEMQKNFIKEIVDSGNENIKNKNLKIQELIQEIDFYTKENFNITEIVTVNIEEQEKVASSTDKLKKLGNLKGKLTQKINSITKEHKFFTENSTCPTCTQKIDEDFRNSKISEIQGKIKEINNGYVELENAIKSEEQREKDFIILSKQISNLNNEILQNNTRINSNQRQIEELNSEIQKITEQIKNQNQENSKLEKFQFEQEKTIENLLTKKEELVNYEFAFSLLKDDGVKTKIIKKYLPFINQQVNRYLQMMDFYINFHLDEEFNESVKSAIYEDFTYTSFSEGERMRIDLALLFTWREVAKIKNSINTNILIMDEVFDSSLDGFGTDEFLKIIKYVIQGANVFVISHKTDLFDKFDTVIKFDKKNGFSYKTIS